MALNIFEPRYRLMVRRCMEGSRRLGMAIVTTGTGESAVTLPYTQNPSLVLPTVTSRGTLHQALLRPLSLYPTP